MARKKQKPQRAGLGVARVPLKKKKRTCKRWTPDEQERVVTAFTLYPRKWTKIAEYVGTKTPKQTENHGVYYMKQLELAGEEVPPEANPGWNGGGVARSTSLTATCAALARRTPSVQLPLSSTIAPRTTHTISDSPVARRPPRSGVL